MLHRTSLPCLNRHVAAIYMATVTCICRYILPSLSLVPADPEEAVRVQYALILAQLAAAASRFLLHMQQLANAQLPTDPSNPALVRSCSDNLTQKTP